MFTDGLTYIDNSNFLTSDGITSDSVTSEAYNLLHDNRHVCYTIADTLENANNILLTAERGGFELIVTFKVGEFDMAFLKEQNEIGVYDSYRYTLLSYYKNDTDTYIACRSSVSGFISLVELFFQTDESFAGVE